MSLIVASQMFGDLDQSSIFALGAAGTMRPTSYTDFWIESLFLSGHLCRRGTVPSVAKVSALYDVSRNHMVKVAEPVGKTGLSAIPSVARMVGSAWRAPESVNIGQVIRAFGRQSGRASTGSPGLPYRPVCLLKSALKEAMNAFFRGDGWLYAAGSAGKP